MLVNMKDWRRIGGVSAVIIIFMFFPTLIILGLCGINFFSIINFPYLYCYFGSSCTTF